ncbi:MAG: exodeoxyribonuclease V subunit beta [Desulfobacterales bacterium]
MMKPLEVMNTPLTGIHLIEASAGTGKTYTIEGLYLRLILERGLSPEQILVVTFTRAATDELKNRIRSKLSNMSEALETGSGVDAFTENMMDRIDDYAAAWKDINRSLVDFDKAAVYTIHGFCRRILAENAFETGCPFDVNVIPEQSELLETIAEDFWRIHFYQAPPELANYARVRLSGPSFFADLAEGLGLEDGFIIGQTRASNFDDLLKNVRSGFQQLKDAWQSFSSDIMNRLRNPCLNANRYGALNPEPDHPQKSRRDIRLERMAKEMDRFTRMSYPVLPLFERFDNFTQQRIISSTKKDHEPPMHPFFALCSNFAQMCRSLESEMDLWLKNVKHAFLVYAQKELARRKQRNGIMHYDDLLTHVRHALDTENGPLLKKRIRQAYRAALVDEFQDTDTLQYHLFLDIFGHSEGLFVMIGDPKQAIYDFRGADIFSYMAAAQNTQSTYTLQQNYRSESCLITAVNTVFSNRSNPFLFKNINYETITPGNSQESNIYGIPSGLVIWHPFFENGSEPGKVIPKQVIMPRAADAVALEIIQLMRRSGNALLLKDIAVLVRTNRQARLMQDHLTAAGISAVLYQTGSVFETREALEIQRILHAVSEPGSRKQLKAALSTDILGATANELYTSDSPVFEMMLSRFKTYQMLWKKHGFIRMFRRLLSEAKAKERLMKYPDGERRLTNIIHLSEILHKTDREKQFGIKGVIKWLYEKRASEGSDLEEHLIRLESDADAVHILTIHKSKGLEFPIVFCPFPWDGSTIRDNRILYHDPENNHRRVMDLGSADFDDHKRHARDERLAENIRLLYVALTRAKTRCYMVWGRIKGADTAAAAYLFHYTKSISAGITEALQQEMTAASDERLFDDLNRLADKSKHAITVAPLPEKHNDDVAMQKTRRECPLQCRRFSKTIGRSFGIASYSSLIHGIDAEGEEAEGDAVISLANDGRNVNTPENENDRSDDFDILKFPGGIRTGLLFHDLFQNAAYEEAENGGNFRLIEEKLNEYGFDIAWCAAVEKMMQQVLQSPLRCDKEGDVGAPALSSIPKPNRIHEMAFYFRMKQTLPADILAAVNGTGRGGISPDIPLSAEKMNASPIEGFMKGYVDMVFVHDNRYFIVDWKSNYLGPSPEDYRRELLKGVMEDRHYVLQYHIYTLALHRYLALRMPGYRYVRNFGGVFYLFVRGMDAKNSSGPGIFYDKPDAFRISLLETLLTT